jgi:hypothetical protein
MKIYKGWHFEAYPKLDFDYFTDRLQKNGADKATKAFMTRLRKVYKGEEVLEDFIPNESN